jgi:hypothetical protein
MNKGSAGDFNKTLETAVECGFGEEFVTFCTSNRDHKHTPMRWLGDGG